MGSLTGTAEYGPSSSRVLLDGATRDETEEGAVDIPEWGSDSWWLKRATDAYESSDDWFNNSVRRKIEDAMRLFNNEHTRGSKYHTPAYEKRSKLFRPKLRGSMRKLEAATAAAFFSTQDAVTCQAPNPGDRMQALAATVNSELLNYRLTTDIPWFVTCLMAMQDAGKQGVVISRQGWAFREVEKAYANEIYDELTGEKVGETTDIEREVVKDHPYIQLRPIENIRLSPGCDFMDPINSSPYLIDIEPFYIGDILERMQNPPPDGNGVRWKKMSRDRIMSAMKQDYDSIRQAREGTREDRMADVTTAVADFDIVWVHHNVIRVDGEDWYFDTLGTSIMLSDPIPLSEAFPPLKGGKRPWSMGYAVMESHKTYPESLVNLGKPLAEAFNDNANLRYDNIQHILSPRYFIRRGAQIDMRSLLRNVPGGVTTLDDPQGDVNVRQIHDTTGSSHEEHDRLSIELDDLLGSFSGASVGSNRNLNETVGGMEMIEGGADKITDLTLRTFSETWVETTLNQIMELEQMMESDEAVIAISGSRAGVHPEVAFRMLQMPVKVTVNVGFGATNPTMRLEKVMMAFRAFAQVAPDEMQNADKAEIASEIFGAVGFKNAERFFPGLSRNAQQDPRVKQLEQQVAQLSQMLESGVHIEEVRNAGKQMVAEITQRGTLQRTQMQLEHEERKQMTAAQLQLRVAQMKSRKDVLDFHIKREANALRRQELMQQKEALEHSIMMDELELELKRQTVQQANPPQPQLQDKGGEKSDGKAEVSEPRSPEAVADIGREGPVNLPGDDKAGVIARGQYGAVPFEEG